MGHLGQEVTQVGVRGSQSPRVWQGTGPHAWLPTLQPQCGDDVWGKNFHLKPVLWMPAHGEQSFHYFCLSDGPGGADTQLGRARKPSLALTQFPSLASPSPRSAPATRSPGFIAWTGWPRPGGNGD